MFHREIGTFDDTNLDADTRFRFAILSPPSQLFQHVEGVRQISLKNNSGFELFKLGFFKECFEYVDGQLQISILFHIEVHKLWSLCSASLDRRLVN